MPRYDVNLVKKQEIYMQNKDKKTIKTGTGFSADPSEMRKAPGYENAVPGVNTPTIELPAFNPPVPNRAWTEMKNNIEALSAEERRDLLTGR